MMAWCYCLTAIAKKGQPAYLYSFGLVSHGAYQKMGAGHWVETLYNLRPNAYCDSVLNFTYNAEEIAFGQKLQQYWYSFLLNGSPNNITGVQAGGVTLNNQIQV